MVAESDTVAKRQLRGIGLSAIGRPRPSFLTPELFESVTQLIASGKTLKYCAETLNFSESNFRFALANDSQLAAAWALAKQQQADALEDDLLVIADDRSQDVIERTLKNGETVEVQNSEFIARSKVRIDTRKWLMSKINPKKYGERLEVDQKVTHEVGDSVQSLFGAIRAEAEKIDATIERGAIVDVEPEPVQQVEISSEEEVC